MPITILRKGKGPEAGKIKRKMGMMNVSPTISIEQQSFITTANTKTGKDNASSYGQSDVKTPIYEQAMLTDFGQFSVLKASTQITLSKTLEETLKYLKAHANDRKKEHVFGELWQILSTNNEDSEKNPYKGELLEFQIDNTSKNIFAA